jgi:peroxiredoxin
MIKDSAKARRNVKKLVCAVLVSLFTTYCINVSVAGEAITDFSLIDHEGRFFQLSRHADQNAVVLVTLSENKRDLSRFAKDLGSLAEQFSENGIKFFFMDSSGAHDKALLSDLASDTKIPFPILIDDTQLIAEALGVTRGLETVILSPKSKELVFRGALNDRFSLGSKARKASVHYAGSALSRILEGSEPLSDSVESKGELISFNDKALRVAALSYENDIAPILEQRCISCHVEGGIAPFAMSNHQMIKGWSPMIREVLMTKRMPPGQIDKEYSNEFHSVNQISVEETQKLVHWIEDGARYSGARDPLAELNITRKKWAYGEPDMIVKIPPQQIPATGVQDYRNLVVPLDLEEDVWVKAVEFVAGDTTVLHHIIAWASAPQGRGGGAFGLLNQGIGLGAYAPGNSINTYPEGSGFPLKVGSGLRLQMHYTTSGKEATDASEIGIYLWDEEPEKRVLGGSAADLDISIAPFEANHEMVASKKFRKDAYLTMVGPHMHYRGTDANFKLVYPDGDTEEILNVPNYQFNWQKTYDFKEPKFIPAGTEMVFRATFDNSEMNPSNPDPSDEISWGEQSWQEMFFGFFRYIDADNGD